jgi:hypothetical protein
VAQLVAEVEDPTTVERGGLLDHDDWAPIY